MRVTEHFGLPLRQDEIDFVDVPIDADVQLFVDPFALSTNGAQWAQDATARLRDFFQLVLDAIRSGNRPEAIALLAGVSEPNDARLGFSRGRPSGASIGTGQAESLVDALEESEANRTGRIDDITECELVVPGIGRDKISDITVSVVRPMLIEYTQTQCRIHGIPVRTLPSGRQWTPMHECGWRPMRTCRASRARAPRLLLVPKHIVRYELGLTAREYYDKFVVSYLQNEYASAGQSLSVALGQRRRRRVTKKEVKARHPFSKPFVADFADDHPALLDEYKTEKAAADQALSNRDIDHIMGDEREWTPDSLIAELSGISAGADNADAYERWVERALSAIFYPALVQPDVHKRINNGRKIIDITFSHRAESGTFWRLSQQYSYAAMYIPFECKNYSPDPANPEVDQLVGRLDDTRSRIGVIVCRHVANRDLMAERCADVRRQRNGVVFWLTDDDLVELLRSCGDRTIDWSLIEDRIRLILDR